MENRSSSAGSDAQSSTARIPQPAPHLATAQRTRGARRIRILARIEGIAPTRHAGPRGRSFLHDWRGWRDLGLTIALLLAVAPLLAITWLRLRLSIAAALGLIARLRLAIAALRRTLGRRRGGNTGLGRWLTWRRRHAAL